MLTQERKDHLTNFQSNFGYTFSNIALLNKALTHKSYVNESPDKLKNNERFEFLGDSVLDLIVSHFLVKKYLDYAEGALSKIRAAVVNETCLAGLARGINLGAYLLLGKGEELSGGRNKNSLLANAFEAVAGAIYFDSSYDKATEILLPKLMPEILKYAETWEFRDFKSELQEYTQIHLNCIPTYQVINEFGPDHAKQFEITVSMNNEIRGQGIGKSKKEAEQAAAKAALLSLQ